MNLVVETEFDQGIGIYENFQPQFHSQTPLFISIDNTSKPLSSSATIGICTPELGRAIGFPRPTERIYNTPGLKMQGSDQ
jgi:hypothetical protein